MKQENDGRKIKRLFQDLRREDAAQSPAFARVWQSAMARKEQQRQAMPGLRFAVACVVLAVFLGAALFLYQNRQRIAGDTGSLTTWRSPTASLLRLPPASPATGSTLDPAPEVAQECKLSGWQSPTGALRKSIQTRSFHKILRQDKYL